MAKEGAYDTVLNVPMPQVFREACAIVGVKQHWKVFTNLSIALNGSFNCRPVIIGVVGEIIPEEDNQREPLSTVLLPQQHVNLLKWKKHGFSNAPVSYHTTADTIIHDYDGTKQTTSSLWERWYDHIHANDFAMMSTGDYFCRVWERERNVRMSVGMDGKNMSVSTEYGLSSDEVVRVVTNFCLEWRLDQDECQQLWLALENLATRERMTSYYYLAVCDGVVRGLKHDCDTADLIVDKRGTPSMIKYYVEGLV